MATLFALFNGGKNNTIVRTKTRCANAPQVEYGTSNIH
jgi:hypothetical protein